MRTTICAIMIAVLAAVPAPSAAQDYPAYVDVWEERANWRDFPPDETIGIPADGHRIHTVDSGMHYGWNRGRNVCVYTPGLSPLAVINDEPLRILVGADDHQGGRDLGPPSDHTQIAYIMGGYSVRILIGTCLENGILPCTGVCGDPSIR